MRQARATLALFMLFVALPARADERVPDPSAELRLIESVEVNEDPLGLDPSTGQALDDAARKLKKPEPKPLLPTPSQGEVLSTIDRVSESAHEVDISLEQGLAFVRVRAQLTSQSTHRADVAYRLALPEGAVVTGVRACQGKQASCVDAFTRPTAHAQADRPGPFVRAEPIRDARGPALAILLSSVVRDEPLELRVSYVAEAPVRGGRARFTLPARGQDPRAGASRVRVSTAYAAELEPAQELSVEPSWELGVQATLRAGRPERASTRVPCGAQACERRFEALPSGPLSARPLWLALDASPSMEGPARARLDMALAALLTVLPDQAEVRALSFAARAREIGRYRAASVPLATLSDALLSDLGPGTRPSALASLLGQDRARAEAPIVIFSDGHFDPSAREQRALSQLARRSELWLVALSDNAQVAPESFRESGGGVLHLAPLADRALRSGNLEALAEALQVIASPKSKSGVHSGEQRVVESRPRTLRPADGPWLLHWLARHEPQPRWITVRASRDEGAIVVPAFLPLPAAAPPADTGMPAESVLEMLRTQLLPRARACLRTDRKGRGDYAVQVTFHALFAQREIFDVRIEGSIEEPLRRCLEGVLGELRVPTFTGRIRVRYPIHTEREPDPPTIELEPDVAEQVERVIRGPARPP